MIGRPAGRRKSHPSAEGPGRDPGLREHPKTFTPTRVPPVVPGICRLTGWCSPPLANGGGPPSVPGRPRGRSPGSTCRREAGRRDPGDAGCRWRSASSLQPSSHYVVFRTVQGAAGSASRTTSEMLGDPAFWRSLVNTFRWNGLVRRPAVLPGAGPGAPAQPAVSRPADLPVPRVPALGGADLPVGAELGVAVQPDHRPAAALDGGGRPAG